MKSHKLIGFVSFACALQVAVAQDCTVIATPMSFGAYDPYRAGPSDATGTIEFACPQGTPYTIRLGSGQNASDGTQRRMRHVGGMGMLAYNLYRNAAATETWGDGSHSTFVQTGIADRATERLLIYGRIPGRQKVRAGLYVDAVTVTAEW